MNKQQTPLGDSHDGGKSAVLVEKNGYQFIRKPRSACVERAFEAFLLGLKREGFFRVPRCVNILREDEHSHDVEIVENTPAQTMADVQEYFYRCGVLLFLAYLLGSNDLHRENLIACANSPVLVDVETLLTGTAQNRTGSTAVGLNNTVLKSHLLANWMLANGALTECGGLSGSADGCKNLLIFGGQAQNAYDFEKEILCGFSDIYTFISQRKENISALLGVFGCCRVRQLMRPTQVYAAIGAIAAKLDGEEKRRLVTAMLRRAYDNDIDKDRYEKARRVCESEVSAVLRGDIPLFSVSGEGTDLCDSDGVVLESFLERSPVDTARDRLFSLSPDDMETQARVISNTLASLRPLPEKPTENTFSAVTMQNNKTDSSFLTDIIEEIEHSSVPALTAGFMHLDAGSNETLCLQSVDYGLYDGLAGILCCYAAVYRATGSKRVKEYLVAHGERLKPIVESDEKITLNDENCSMQSGAGGVIAALLHIAELTGESKYHSDAIKIAERIDTDTPYGGKFDLLCGAASLALSLPRLPQSIAAATANALLPCLLEYEPALTGVAHGAAGAALALAAIGQVLLTSAYDDKIFLLINHENSFFDENECNWQDLRESGKISFMRGWCSGAPGIGMARAQMLKYTNNAEISAQCERDIERAKKLLLFQKSIKRDTLCCGLASHITAGARLGVQLPQALFSLRDGAFFDSARLYHPLDTRDKNVSLMQGLCGVCYALAMHDSELSGGMLI